MAWIKAIPEGDAEGEQRITSAHKRSEERSAVYRLAAAGIASALIYVVMFTLPYSLSKLQAAHQVDLAVLVAKAGHAEWGLLPSICVLGVLYWYAWRAALQARSPAAWAVVIGSALLSTTVLLFMYPIGSTDVFDNIMHGRMVSLYHANPFINVPAEFPRDVFSAYVGWPRLTTVYGPLWVALAGVVARLGGATVFSNVIAFKLLEVPFLAGCALMIGLVLRRGARERALAGVLLLTWNPIVLYETAGNGHNDLVMVFFILAAAAAIYYRRYTLAILLLVGGALVKFVPLLMLPAAGLIALRELPDRRARLRFLILTALLSTAVIGLSYAPFWHGLETLTFLIKARMITSSLPNSLLRWLQSHVLAAQALSIISRAALVAIVLFALLEGLRAWRDRSWLSFTRSAFHISVFVILCTLLWLMPWYSLWPLALAALRPPGGATLLAQVMAFSFFSKPFFQAYLFLREPAGLTWISPWMQLRHSPAILGAPRLTAIGLLVASLVW